MKRILIFSLTYFPTRVGGAEVAIREIAGRQDPDAYAFDLITLRIDKRLPKTERMGNMTVHRIGLASDIRELGNRVPLPVKIAKALYPLDACLTALALQRRHAFDGAWAMMAAYAGFAAVLFSFFHPRIPYLLTLQEGDPIEEIRRKVRPIRFLFDRIFLRAKRIQAISSYLATWARDMGYRGEVDVVANGVDTARFAGEAKPIDPAGVRLITTSRLVRKNAVDDIIRALAHLPSARLQVVGSGPEEQELRRLAASLGVADRVEFSGHRPYESLPGLLHAADIFIRPSRSEGMGNSFIEAMAAGIPVIATQEGGIADFLFDADLDPGTEPTGFAVPKDSPEEIAKAVERILADPRETERTVRNAKRLVEDRYDWERIGQEMREVFDRSFGG